MKTHNGKKIIGQQLINARTHAAKGNDNYAKAIMTNKMSFPPHVTREKQIEIADHQLAYAKEIRAGKHDSNFTIWQRMDTFITGKCIGFLPKTL